MINVCPCLLCLRFYSLVIWPLCAREWFRLWRGNGTSGRQTSWETISLFWLWCRGLLAAFLASQTVLVYTSFWFLCTTCWAAETFVLPVVPIMQYFHVFLCISFVGLCQLTCWLGRFGWEACLDGSMQHTGVLWLARWLQALVAYLNGTTYIRLLTVAAPAGMSIVWAGNLFQGCWGLAGLFHCLLACCRSTHGHKFWCSMGGKNRKHMQKQWECRYYIDGKNSFFHTLQQITTATITYHHHMRLKKQTRASVCKGPRPWTSVPLRFMFDPSFVMVCE